MSSTSETSVHSIVKADRSGRTRYTNEYKAEVLAAFEKSGMSGQAFAAHCGIKYPTFAAWRSKAQKAVAEKSAERPGPSFLIAEVAPSRSHSDCGLRVELPGGAVARVNDQDSLGLLVTLLKSLS